MNMSLAKISQPKKKTLIIILILFLLVIAILAKLIFFQPTNIDDEGLTQDNQTWEKSIKHGKLIFSSGVGSNSQVEFWFDAPSYRLTWYKDDGSPRLHMISLDGKQLYFADPAKETSKLAYLSPEMHLWIFNGPEEYLTKETRSEDDFEITHYELDKLWEIEGASQDFYLKDLEIYSKDNKTDKIITRTSSKKPESDEDLSVSTYQITQLEFTNDIDPTIFELPYQIE